MVPGLWDPQAQLSVRSLYKETVSRPHGVDSVLLQGETPEGHPYKNEGQGTCPAGQPEGELCRQPPQDGPCPQEHAGGAGMYRAQITALSTSGHAALVGLDVMNSRNHLSLPDKTRGW